MRILHGRAAAAGAIALFAAAAPGHAASVDVAFGGEVTSLTTFGVAGAPGLESALSPGDAVSGRFVYDLDAAPDAAASPTSQRYGAAVTDFSISVGAFSFDDVGPGAGTARDDHMAGSAAPLRDAFFALNSVAGPAVGGQTPAFAQVSVGAGVLTTLVDLDLPSAALLNELFAVNVFDGNTNFLAFAGGETARFSLTNLTATPLRLPQVPLPAAAPLLLAALGALAAFRRRAA
ncbi:MAG: VPLPA-CTERM sorting domain-containing protein [Pseudomonadota bacterium]